MYLFGQIVDSSTKRPLQSASVIVLSNLSIPRFIGVTTGADGYFDLDNASIQQSDKLLISFVGYKSITINVSDVLTAMDLFPDNGGLWQLTPNYVTLPPVVITHPPTTNKNSTPMLLGALLLLFALSDNKKGRRVSGADTTANFIEKHWKLLAIGAGTLLFLPQIARIIANLLKPFKAVSNAIDALFSVGTGVITSSMVYPGSFYETAYNIAKDYVSHHVYDAKQDADHKQYLYDHFDTTLADQLFSIWQQPKGALYFVGTGVNG